MFTSLSCYCCSFSSFSTQKPQKSWEICDFLRIHDAHRRSGSVKNLVNWSTSTNVSVPYFVVFHEYLRENYNVCVVFACKWCAFVGMRVLRTIVMGFCKHNLTFFCRCDADPAALAKYVIALVKKDKSQDALRQSMISQLEVFLERGT